ncbi:hypothetical protein LTR08_002585 [Meristemomyces frigidus]|nr:hypothetical protein LTR08_002585 [Meristemomyces frigidus]
MPHPVTGVSSDSHGNTATITQEPPQALPELCARVHRRLEVFLGSEAKTERLRQVQDQSRLSMKILEEALERYSLDELSLSYNGGKDCLVLLILYLSALHAHSTKASTTASHLPPFRLPQTLRSVYIISAHPFAQVDDFVDSSLKTYHLSLARYAKPMKEAFADYLSDLPNVKAIFVGTRRTDPHGAELQHFHPTDRGWPAFMRIHPVIDWHYAEIWAFIREMEIPYCGLYDLGYTSLGGTEDTHPNPALKDDPGGEAYRPAYELVEDDAERLDLRLGIYKGTMAEPDDPIATVVNTPELLENILCRLDERTLLLSHRVSQTFKATIDGSVKLQRKLFFQLEPVTDVQQDPEAAKIDDGVCTSRSFNSLLRRRLNHSSKAIYTHIWFRGNDKSQLSSLYTMVPQYEGSWRRMYLAYTDRVKFGMTVNRNGTNYRIMEDTNRLTLGEIVDLCDAEHEVSQRRRVRADSKE